jgi:Asp-tRNA(Asn)/Glu-tRNA(Gln) amidotransferase A subunit family amidase
MIRCRCTCRISLPWRCRWRGCAGLSLPCGFDGAGLPIGLQVMGRAFDEATVLRVAHAYEQATEWHSGGFLRQPVGGDQQEGGQE